MSGSWQQNNWDNKKPWERNWYDPANPAFQQQQQQQEADRRRQTDETNASLARSRASADAAQAAQRAAANAQTLRNGSTQSSAPISRQHHQSPASPPQTLRKPVGGRVMAALIVLGAGVYGAAQAAAYYEANFSSEAITMKAEADRCVARNDHAIDDGIGRKLITAQSQSTEHAKGVQYCVNIVRSHHGGHTMPTINP